MRSSLPLLAIEVALYCAFASAQSPGSIVQVGNTLVSAMMVGSSRSAVCLDAQPSQMFLGNEEKIYILDKAEGNSALINGHPAWGSVWQVCINSHVNQC